MDPSEDAGGKEDGNVESVSSIVRPQEAAVPFDSITDRLGIECFARICCLAVRAEARCSPEQRPGVFISLTLCLPAPPVPY